MMEYESLGGNISSMNGKFGSLNRPDGSAEYTEYGYSIVCSVNGPMEVRARDEDVRYATIECIVRPEQGLPGTKERRMEENVADTIAQIIHRSHYPRSLIQVTLQILSRPEASLEGGGGFALLQSALLNSAMLALLDAGVECMAMMVSNVTCIDPAIGAVVADPSLAIWANSHDQMVIAFAYQGTNNHPKLIYLEGSGNSVSYRDHLIASEKCYIEKLHLVRQMVERKIQSDFKWF